MEMLYEMVVSWNVLQDCLEQRVGQNRSSQVIFISWASSIFLLSSFFQDQIDQIHWDVK